MATTDSPSQTLLCLLILAGSPPEVYAHLDWLKSQLSYEVKIVSNGNIRDNILEGKMPDGSKFLGIPAFLVNPDGSSGILRRQCTTHYKTNPINNYLRKET